MNVDAVERPLRIGLISLGCAKNLVDGEIMLGSLLKAGAEITNDPARADVLIVNTCSFIEAAQQEGVDTILETAEVRRARHPGQTLIVAGCLPQRFREELPKLLPEVDAFMGIDQVARVHEIVQEATRRRRARIDAGKARVKHPTKKGTLARRTEGKTTVSKPLVEVNSRPAFIPDYATPRYRLTPRHLAYVKIAEGCNHPCSFCIIPRMRGPHRSRGEEDVLKEAGSLLADGAKELNLISQDTTYYGLDLRRQRDGSIASPEKFRAAAQVLRGQGPTLCSLLRRLNTLEGDFWIRLLYTHPAHWTDELIETIGECQKVARYVDIPLQHIHELMLERMRRETSRDYIVDLLRKIRRALPGITLRTTFIVGFPGETEKCFESLLEFIRETKFERLGVFTYSQEEGTRAGRMENQIPDRVKQQRRDRAMAVQHEVATQVSEAFVGRTLKVLVESEAGEKELKQAKVFSWEHGFIRDSETHVGSLTAKRYMVARGEADAPDIDGRVYVRGRVKAGEFAQVKIIGHTDYDLIAETAHDVP